MARRQTVTVRHPGSGVDTSDFRAVASALRRAEPLLAKELRNDLREAGLIVAAKAKEIAREHSQKIPPTVKVRVAGTTVAVVAGGEDAPQAGLFELGNTGGMKSASASEKGKFRHPVFGNRDVWVEQDMHPFLAPAALSEFAHFDRMVGRSLDKVTRLIVEGRE